MGRRAMQAVAAPIAEQPAPCSTEPPVAKHLVSACTTALDIMPTSRVPSPFSASSSTLRFGLATGLIEHWRHHRPGKSPTSSYGWSSHGPAAGRYLLAAGTPRSSAPAPARTPAPCRS